MARLRVSSENWLQTFSDSLRNEPSRGYTASMTSSVSQSLRVVTTGCDSLSVVATSATISDSTESTEVVTLPSDLAEEDELLESFFFAGDFL